VAVTVAKVGTAGFGCWGGGADLMVATTGRALSSFTSSCRAVSSDDDWTTIRGCNRSRGGEADYEVEDRMDSSVFLQVCNGKVGAFCNFGVLARC
jgi:hypothetical protein